MLTDDNVTVYLNGNPNFVKEYFLQHASPELVESWVLQRSKRLSATNVKRITRIRKSCLDVTTPILATSNTKLSKFLGSNAPAETSVKPKKQIKELSALDENDLLMELIRDIAYELDVDSLSHKILVNVALLTNCDRSSLFLCKGHKDRKYLVSRLFDVTSESKLENSLKPENEAIIIPFGVGIAGHAAATGKTVNIKDAYKDPRFNPAIDKETGYHTHSILCMPIKNQDSEVIGVAQIINKKKGTHTFTDKDEEVFKNYLTFCGIGLTNAELFESSIQEFQRNQVLLNLAKNIFEDTENLETVVRRIMTQALELLQCERCTVYILDRSQEDEEKINFSIIYDLEQNSELVINKDYYKDLAEKSTNNKFVHVGFAIMTAQTGEILNIDNFNKTQVLKSKGKTEDSDKQLEAKSMLCCPILNNQQEVIGVAQLLNKIGAQSFDDNDESMFEAFTIFCGLGIYNTQMYEKAALMLARQKVNLEILQYHASAGPVVTNELALQEVPPGDKYNIYSFDFDDIDMTDNETCLMSARMFLDFDLLKKFNIPYKTMCHFILTVRKNYRPVIYHNWRHGFNVAQTMFTLLTTGQMYPWFTDLENLVLLVACLCHDLDHRGTNNTFQMKSESPIARLYGTSTMERHHFDHSVMILKSEGCNIFDTLSDNDYKLAMKMLEDAILSTDLALYFKKRTDFQNEVESNNVDWTVLENRSLLRGMMMTACDVAAITKPWEVQQRVAELVASEFFEQGDLERKDFSAQPIPMMDRSKHGELPKMQVGFIDFVCMPIYKVFYHINPLLKPLYDGVLDNKKNWQQIEKDYVPDRVVIKEPPKDFEATNSHKQNASAVTHDMVSNSKSCVLL